MDNETYLKLSARTASGVKNKPIRSDDLTVRLQKIIEIGHLADYMKRKYFYDDKNAHVKFNENEDKRLLVEMSLLKHPNSGIGKFDLTDKQVDLYHAILGMQSELAEITLEFVNSIAENRDVDDVNLAEESGDMLWYIALKLRALNSDLSTVMRKNIAKLQKRFKDKFTPEEAVDRDLDAERKVLEND